MRTLDHVYGGSDDSGGERSTGSEPDRTIDRCRSARVAHPRWLPERSIARDIHIAGTAGSAIRGRAGQFHCWLKLIHILIYQYQLHLGAAMPARAMKKTEAAVRSTAVSN